MNYLTYLLLALLFTCSVGPSGTEPVSERVQKLFNTMEYHVATCPKEGNEFSLYRCPSHLWPELLQNFIPMVSSLQMWIKQRIGAGAVFWDHLIMSLRGQIAKYDTQVLGKIRDEAIAWTLLNRYLDFPTDKSDTFSCLASTLNALTDLELNQVSRLPYHGNSDLFEEINELIDDPKKARLLDGLKRASRNDVEMSNMLASLRRWLKRSEWEDEIIAIFNAAFDSEMRSIPIEQLNAETISVPNFQEDPELTGVLSVIFNPSLYSQLDISGYFLQNYLPQSLPGRGHIIGVLTRLGDETGGAGGCRISMQSALESYGNPKDWKKVLSHTVCVMVGLSKLPDEFFEEYGKLDETEWFALNTMLYKAEFPVLPT